MSSEKKEIIILGVDPGTIITGFGAVLFSGNKYKTLDYGRILPPPKESITNRIAIIQQSMEEIIQRLKPDVLSIELQFFPKNHNNPLSALKVGMARGVICVAAKRMGLHDIYEYMPSVAKQAIVGNGRASKEQVRAMIKHLLGLTKMPHEDAADALALAICHAHSLNSKKAIGQKI